MKNITLKDKQITNHNNNYSYKNVNVSCTFVQYPKRRKNTNSFTKNFAGFTGTKGFTEWLYVLIKSRTYVWILTLYLPECQGTPCSKQAGEIWSLSDCNETRTHSHLVRKWTLKIQILRLFGARRSLKFRQIWNADSLWRAYVTW